MNKLKHCPFCNAEAKQLNMNRIGCKKCGIRTASHHSRLRNIKIWNKRSESIYKEMWDKLKWEVDWNIGNLLVYNKMLEIESELNKEELIDE